MQQDSYTGGAHGNQQIELVVFDAIDGRRLALEDLCAKGAIEELGEAAESRFRESKGIAPDADLEAAGYWFEDGRFTLAEDFALTNTGILFHYDAYEIAPYATGPTDFELETRGIEGLLRSTLRPGDR